MAIQSTPLNPTFEGHIASTLDALVLFEGCLSGQLNHVPRRPHDRERQDLIKSGYVFIYEEHASGIKRWTDGVSWSPSRILGNFLIYRELEKPFPPGEKKRALKKSKKCQQGVSKSESSSRLMPDISAFFDASTTCKDTERSLIGSLIDSYPFKSDGLIKKTISISFQGVPHHLVSYYSVADVISGRLSTPTKDDTLRNIIPRPELLMSQNFRAPIEEVEYSTEDRTGQLFATISTNPEFNGPGGMIQRGMSLPRSHPTHMSSYVGMPGPYEFSGPQRPHHHHDLPHHLSNQLPLHPQVSHPTYLPYVAGDVTSSIPSISSNNPPEPYASQNQGNYGLGSNFFNF